MDEEHQTAVLSVEQLETASRFISFHLITSRPLWFQGESFYNPYIPATLDRLRAAGLVQESEGAQCIFVEGHKVPLIVVKSDGGFNYATTDLACLW